MKPEELLFELDQISKKYKGKPFDVHSKNNVIEDRIELIQQACKEWCEEAFKLGKQVGRDEEIIKNASQNKEKK